MPSESYDTSAVRAWNGVSAMSENYKPGQKAPASAQYEEVGPRGGRTGHEITSTKGNPLPPTQKSGNGYVVADRTKNGSGKGK
jgi:hypothetical protein